MHWAISGDIRRLKRKSLIGQAVLLTLSVELFLIASFTGLQLPVPTQHNLERLLMHAAQGGLDLLPLVWQQYITHHVPPVLAQIEPVRYSVYVPLVPVAIFTGYTLGGQLGLTAVALFLLMGIAGPGFGMQPLASGGGIEYWRQPTCGYLLGLLAGAWFSGRITAVAATSARQLLAVGGSLTIIHALGLLYLFGASLGLLLFQGDGAFLKWQPWLFESVRNLSWYTLPYDALFSVGLVGIGFPVRWLVAILTAPDIAMRTKSRFENEGFEEDNADIESGEMVSSAT